MRLPVRVTHPTIPERPIATQVAYNSTPGSGMLDSWSLLRTSDKPTSADAPPPKPLNKATNSGISVIPTRVAMKYPMVEPITNPPIINSYPITSSVYIFTSVTSTARSMPYAPSMLPCGAVLGLDSLLIPRMNNAAETKYPMSHTTESTISPHLFASYLQSSPASCL